MVNGNAPMSDEFMNRVKSDIEQQLGFFTSAIATRHGMGRGDAIVAIGLHVTDILFDIAPFSAEKMLTARLKWNTERVKEPRDEKAYKAAQNNYGAAVDAFWAESNQAGN